MHRTDTNISSVVADGADSSEGAARPVGRRKFSDAEKKQILNDYIGLPRGQRRQFAIRVGVEPSLISRWHYAFFGKPLSAREPGDPIEPTHEPRTGPRNPRGKGPGPGVRSVSRAAYDQLKAEVTLLKGLLHIANQRGFLEHFLAFEPEEEAPVDPEGDK